MELKPPTKCGFIVMLHGFNRTFMELKRRLTKQLQRMVIGLIVPLWN